MTLIEVMLAAAILGILAVAVASALFYPSYLVVNSALEQSAIHAGTAEIERHLDDFQTPATSGVFRTAGLAPIKITTTQTLLQDNIHVQPARYVQISTTIEYRDGKTVDLVTYRSQMMLSSERHAP